ncbi:hypothetical protein [Lentzea cavernae]|uniref:Uncharacterized protein n=1 Tax=Lentzea cavernae TaxID=2020703 RepID=A0ABQ3MTD5_9PSEU|nr:hypothetical protein [Lentzea cavernae]GHH57882.1 hypothetical protein GCM10017774_78330 [Lentzea cavernae]
MDDLVSRRLEIARYLAKQVADAAQRVGVLCGNRDLALSRAKEAGATDEQLAEAAHVNGQEMVEHAQRYAGGSMLVRNPHPDIERIYPVPEWIRDEQRNGGKLYRRTVVVLEDWTEIEEQPT